MSESASHKLVPKITISDNTSEVFCIKFAPEGNYLAAGCGDGAIRVFSTQNGSLAYNLQSGSNVALPTTALKFRPPDATNSRTKNVFLAANAAGAIQHWHMTSGKCLHSFADAENQVYCLDYNEDGSQFVCAGKDTVVRVYDEATKSIVQAMSANRFAGSRDTTGHSNRIFSARYVPQDQNLLMTGGWDNTVMLWDVRVGGSIRSFYGAHIAGDALDIYGNEVLTGSWRPDNQLELWDFGSGAKISTIPWDDSVFSNIGRPACMLYAAQFSKDGRYIVAGGSGANEAKVFDHKADNAIVGTVTGLTRGIFTVDFSPDNHQVAIAGGDATIRILSIVSK
jgi:COMPASS component SWD3